MMLVLLFFILLNPLEVVAAESNAEYEAIADEIAEDYNLCPELIYSIMFYESSFTPDAVSKAGCVGLMQIHPNSHKARMKKLGVTDLTDPRQNILVGCDYLAELFKQYEDVGIVLDAYAGTLKADAVYETGFISKHAKLVLDRAALLERKNGK